MPFSYRVFCRELVSPSLSEVLVWLRQSELFVSVCGGGGSNDLLSSFWTEVELSVGDDEAPLRLRCVRADAVGAAALAAEIADFSGDVRELPESASRARVLTDLAATRALVLIEFSDDGGSPRAHAIAEVIMTLFVERAAGLAQRDGVGFLDEDDDVLLALG